MELKMPVIAPLLRNGPSNQIYQAKLAMWSMRDDTTGAALLLPPLLPHYSQQRLGEGAVAFSEYFDVRTRPAAFPPLNLVEEGQVWAGRASPAVTSAIAATVNRTCPVYVADPFARPTPLSERMTICRRYAGRWSERAAGRACGGGFAFLPYNGTLATLAADLAVKNESASSSGVGSTLRPGRHQLALACFLEGYLNQDILMSAVDAPTGGLALRQAEGVGYLPSGGSGRDGYLWLQAANALKFRGLERDSSGRSNAPVHQGIEPSKPRAARSAPQAPATSTTTNHTPEPTSALQLRVPDYEVLAVNRSTKPDTYCLGGSITCNATKQLVLPRERLFSFLAGKIGGDVPAQDDGALVERECCAVKRLQKDSTGRRRFNQVHLLTNDPILAADLAEFLTRRGLAVTASADRSIHSLMEDYAMAVRATMFWGTRSSSIAANIVHARLAAGRRACSTIFWEDAEVVGEWRRPRFE